MPRGLVPCSMGSALANQPAMTSSVVLPARAANAGNADQRREDADCHNGIRSARFRRVRCRIHVIAAIATIGTVTSISSREPVPPSGTMPNNRSMKSTMRSLDAATSRFHVFPPATARLRAAADRFRLCLRRSNCNTSAQSARLHLRPIVCDFTARWNPICDARSVVA
jgi:hypothetical protein